MRDQFPYWRLSSFYLFYYAALGSLLPWWGPYLQHLGFGAAQIGELFAILALTRIAGPLLIGWLADRTGASVLLIRGASWLSALFFAGTLLGTSYLWLALVTLLFSFCWAASLPPVDSMTLRLLGHRTQRYGLLRLWGSLGFIIAVIAAGLLFEQVSIARLPSLVLALFLAIAVSSSCLPAEKLDEPAPRKGSFLGQLLRPAVLSLVAIAVLMQTSHQPYYMFFTIYLGEIGYSSESIGLLWSLGVVAEIGVFLLQGRIFGAASIRSLLLASLALTALRWALVGLASSSLTLLLFVQLLHAASFGLFHAVMVQYMHRIFPGRHHARGQALYTSMCFGVGGAVGSWLGGIAWEPCGPAATFLGAAALPAAALLIALVGLRNSQGIRLRE